MKYFSDERIREMKERVYSEIDPHDRNVYLMYIHRIEELNDRYDRGENCQAELLNAISMLNSLPMRYVHRGKADAGDEDADAYEYENYDFQNNG